MPADPSKKYVLIDRASAERLSTLLAWFESSEFYQPSRKPLRGPRPKGDRRLAVAQEDIAKGSTGDVKFQVGATKGSEEADATVYQAYNRLFSKVPEDAVVELAWQNAGWEITAVVPDDCADLSNPSEIFGYVEGEARALILNASGCWELVELDEDCD